MVNENVDLYLRNYIVKNIQITREQANEINDYKCKLEEKIANLEIAMETIKEYIEKTNILKMDNSSFKINDMRFFENILKIINNK